MEQRASKQLCDRLRHHAALHHDLAKHSDEQALWGKDLDAAAAEIERRERQVASLIQTRDALQSRIDDLTAHESPPPAEPAAPASKEPLADDVLRQEATACAKHLEEEGLGYSADVVRRCVSELNRLYREHDEDVGRMERAAIAIEDMTRQLNERASAEPPAVAGEAQQLAQFTAYFEKNYYGEVFFSDPAWHAKRVFAAAKHALGLVNVRTSEPPSTPRGWKVDAYERCDGVWLRVQGPQGQGAAFTVPLDSIRAEVLRQFIGAAVTKEDPRCSCGDFPGADEFCTAHKFEPPPMGSPVDGMDGMTIADFMRATVDGAATETGDGHVLP